MLDTAEEIYSVTVDDTLTVLSQKMNDLMKTFSAIATIFLPLNLVAALWGMNVIVPGQTDEEDWPFIVICLICAVSFVGAMVYFKKQDLI